MQYLGGKSSIAKYIALHISERMTISSRFVEPFVGGFNIVPHLRPHKALCSDTNLSLINMYKSLQRGWEPPDKLSEQEYHILKEMNDPENPLTAFASFGCSFGGKEWGGYARQKGTDYFSRFAKNSLMRKKLHMSPVEFRCCDYIHIETLTHDVVYCDPPYFETTKYNHLFDSFLFFKWSETLGVPVFISEFFDLRSRGWSLIWDCNRTIKVDGFNEKGRKKTDRLFIGPPIMNNKESERLDRLQVVHSSLKDVRRIGADSDFPGYPPSIGVIIRKRAKGYVLSVHTPRLSSLVIGETFDLSLDPDDQNRSDSPNTPESLIDDLDTRLRAELLAQAHNCRILSADLLSHALRLESEALKEVLIEDKDISDLTGVSAPLDKNHAREARIETNYVTPAETLETDLDMFD